MKHRLYVLLLLIIIVLTALLVWQFGAEGEGGVYVPTPVMLDATVATYEVGITFHRGNALLRDQVWAGLQVLSADGTVGRIAQHWFGFDPTIIPPNPDATAALGEVRARTLIVGFDPASAPKSFFNAAGELVGFDIDLATAVADYFGWDLELLPIRWADREFELQSGNIDTLWGGVTLSETVVDRLYHTPPYMENRQVLVTMSDSGIRNLRGVRNGTLGLLAGSAAELALEENTSFRDSLGEVDLREILYSALIALQHGQVDAVLMDETAAIYYVLTRDGTAFGGRAYLLAE